MIDDIPVRDCQARYAESYLYDDYNDIDFFIEDNDENTKKIILELLQRAFSNEIKVTQIFPLGGRENVIEQYEQRDLTRKQIYIIDGDLYLLFQNEPMRKGLVIFDRYCIENYLFDEQAIHSLLYDECCSESNYENMCQLFNFNTWWNLEKKYLYRLFIEYAIEKENSLGIQTVKHKVHRLVNQTGYELNKPLIKTRIKNLRLEIKNKITKREYNECRINIKNHLNSLNSPKENYISGKDYILPLLFNKIKKYSKSKLPDNHFKYRLSKVCDVSEIKTLVEVHL